MPDQRWAHDLVLEPAITGSSRLEDYGCYGKVVVAPVAARVHHSVDGKEPGLSAPRMLAATPAVERSAGSPASAEATSDASRSAEGLPARPPP